MEILTALPNDILQKENVKRRAEYPESPQSPEKELELESEPVEEVGEEQKDLNHNEDTKDSVNVDPIPPEEETDDLAVQTQANHNSKVVT